MSRNRVIHSLLLATSVLLVGACASQPERPPGALQEKYFQKEASHYMKFEHEGQVVYCQDEPRPASLIPTKLCISEPALRQRVEDARRARNPVQPALVQRG
jgi:hypothetical protein